MAIATDQVFSHTDALVKTWGFAAATPKYTLAVQGGVVGVSLTPTTGIVAPNITDIGPYKVNAPIAAGVGNDKATAIGTFAAGVAVDGTFTFTGVVSTGSTPAPPSTAQGIPVFVTAAGELTLVATGNTRVGVVNYPATYNKAAGKLPIAIGV